MCNLSYKVLQLYSYIFIFFINVFVNLLNNLNRYINLYINVHTLNLNQIRAVENYSLIIYNNFISIYLLNSDIFIRLTV